MEYMGDEYEIILSYYHIIIILDVRASSLLVPLLVDGEVSPVEVVSLFGGSDTVGVFYIRGQGDDPRTFPLHWCDPMQSVATSEDLDIAFA